MAENTPDNAADVIALAGDITVAWLQNPNVNPTAQDVPAFLKAMHAAIAELGKDVVPKEDVATYEPAVSVRSSIKPDHIVSLIDGKKYKTLKRHLAGHGLTPDDYRARYGLKADYPMVSESYAAQRREIAEKLGLGRKRAAPAEVPLEAPVEAVKDTSGLAKAPAKPKPSSRKPKEAVAAPLPAEVAAPAKPKRAPHPAASAKSAPAVAADTVAEPVVKSRASAGAKPRRMVRTPDSAVEAAGDAPVAAPQVEAPAKPKRAAAPKKAPATGEATPKVAAKNKSADAPVKTPRVKKTPAVIAETAVPES